jgi:RHS repeat-associated protein
VKYSGFRRLALTQGNYVYDVEATDPDGDAVTYSLTTAPTGMSINPATGLINWPVTSSEAGDHAVTVRTQDPLGAFDTQSFTLTILNQNQPPVVNAGNDQAVAVNGTATLNGTVTDDGLPRNASVTSTWSMVSGPGLVTFANAFSPSTTATFSEAGAYVLRLTASDTALNASDETVVTVTPPNRAPVVNAGADLAVTIPGTARLTGTATDDGLPLGSALTVSWTQVSGPGTITFANLAAAVTTATFSAAGIYVLRLSAGDTALTSTDELTVTVNPAAPNQSPVVEAGANQSLELNSNRVQNAGNDEQLVNGEIRAWTEAVGSSWTTGSSSVNGFPESVNGGSFFYAGVTASAELRQDIDVSALAATIASGTQSFEWKAYVRSRAETIGDKARVIVEYRNASNTAMIAQLDSGEVSSTNAWYLLEDTRPAPAGTGWIRIRLIATRLTGTTNDAYFDALSLRAVTSAGIKLNGTVTDDGLPAGGLLTTTWSKVSGPGAVTFADAGAVSTSVTFADAGIYVLRLTANDSALTASDELTLTVEPRNLAPVVNGGADQTVTLPATAPLSGTVSDDGKPSGATVTSMWTKVSGPGSVTFANAAALNTTATFGADGTYVLRLKADDTEYSGDDTVTITVNPVPDNIAPTVNAGADQIISPPTTSAALSGTVTDDGQPPASSLTYSWTKASGPGAVTFSSSTAKATNATFTEAGVYVLRLTANDSQLTGSDDVRVTINGTNKAPTVNAGADQTVAHPTSITLSGAATDDGLPIDSTLSFSWSKVSGPGTVTFFNSAAPQTIANFSAAGAYVLRLTASDTALSAADDVTVTQTPPPTVGIISPVDGTTITTRTNFIGTVSGGSIWRLEYNLDEDGVVPAWTTLSSGSTPVTNGTLGTFDPTVLLNGMYTVRLVATNSSGQTTISSVSTIVEGEQKIGNFSLTFNDLDVPVAGIPIQVIRTYDSRDKRKGDFGVGWTLSIRNVRVQESGPAGSGWEGTVTPGFLPNYCIQATRQHIVTVTLSTNEVLKFETTLGPECSRVYPPRETTIGFRALPGTNATLAPVGDPTVFVNASFPGEAELLDYGTIDAKDFQQYRLTLPSGDVLLLDERDGLKEKTDANGNTLTISANGITHSSGKSIAFTRDSSGRIAQITDPLGVTMSYAYDANGDLISYRDRENNVTTYTYNSTHGMLTLKDPRGIQPIRNEYDDTGRLVRQIDAFGKVNTFARDLSLRQEVITDRLGHATVYEYNARGNVVRITNPQGGIITRTYDTRDNMLSETNAEGKVCTFTYDAAGNRLTETDQLSNATRYTYNSRRQVLTVTDPQGHVTTNTYDANGNPTSAKDAAGNTTNTVYNAKGQETSFKDGLGNLTQFAYDASGNVASQTDQLGHATTFVYDANGNKLSETVSRTVGGVVEILVTRYEYNRLGRVTKVTNADGSTEQKAYNVIGQQTSVVDALNRLTSYEYDEMGRLTRTIFADATKEEISYDNLGRRTKVVDRAGRATLNTYDVLGRLLKSVNPDGTFASSTYDTNGMTTSNTDELGHVTRYEYDASRRLVKVTDALNHALNFTYDVNGNRTSMTDSKGQVTRYEYDANQRRTRIVFADGTSSSMTYDALGRTLTKSDQAGQTSNYEYDQRGKLLKVTDASSGITSFTYDEMGNQLTQTDANNHTTVYTYDKVGLRTRRTLPLGMSETYTYDAAAQLLSRTDFNGKVTSYAYDSAGRLTSRTPDASSGQAAVTFTYTPMGLRSTMADASGTTTYAYDARDRLTSKATPRGALTYTYDATGSLLTTRSSNTNGVAVDYTYDALNRLATVIDQRLAVGTTTYSYDLNGNLKSTLAPNQVRSAYTYDSLNRLTNLAVEKGSTIAGYAYELGAAGNRLSVTEVGGRAITYTYDALYRLTSESISGATTNNGAVAYTYDAVGNRLTRNSTVAAVPSTTSTYDANNRLQGDTFDANGNTLQSNGSTYQFDFENRLTSANNGAVTLVYDGDGNRVAKTASGVMTHYLIDTENPTGHAQAVEEIVAGQVQRQYTYGHALISQRQLLAGQRTTSFYGLDGTGSVRFLTNDGGAVTDTYTYDAFGKLIGSTGVTPNPHLYVGEHFENQVGSYYLRARYMNPDSGRFWTMDDFEGMSADPMSLHKYLYANANPTNIADPSGHMGLAMQMPTMGMMMSLASISMVQFMNVVLMVAAVAVISTTVAILVDRIIDMIVVSMTMAGAIATAKAILVTEFDKFRKSSEFQRPGNHWAEFEYPTPPLGNTPRTPIKSYNLGPVKMTEYQGGGPGRVFQFKYGIGANATLGRGLFLFRLDYMSYEGILPQPEFHYHLRYGIINIDHEGL